ncbi:hypothetical protein H6P81_014563 [Aristolochia fimbriata]|uniref:Acyl-[acyl-carrier-protein] desaturase n=1 Tax=Aristolochia fimbriata TaxID=158543 RepID=A0AAV7E7G9_ARIFI|nr:hypothetical protein H6P81_014563 [Aristolochia fimbriata]
MINTQDAVRDESDCSSKPWAVWTRSWTSEENRHGDLLGKYVYLSSRVDMRMVSKTVQCHIGAGMILGTDNNPYLGLAYTSFQERATFTSHGNRPRMAKEGGDPTLARVCGTIAAGKKQREIVYTKIVEKLLEVDPMEAMLAIEDMMKKKIAMSAHLMQDGQDPRLFDHFAIVAQKLSIYTAADYTDILEFLVGSWKLEKISGLARAAAQA